MLNYTIVCPIRWSGYNKRINLHHRQEQTNTTQHNTTQSVTSIIGTTAVKRRQREAAMPQAQLAWPCFLTDGGGGGVLDGKRSELLVRWSRLSPFRDHVGRHYRWNRSGATRCYFSGGKNESEPADKVIRTQCNATQPATARLSCQLRIGANKSTIFGDAALHQHNKSKISRQFYEI